MFLSQKDGLSGLESTSHHFGQVEKDLEKDIANMGMMLAQGKSLSQGEMEAAFGGIVDETVAEVGKAGGVQSFVQTGPAKESPEKQLAQSFLDKAGRVPKRHRA